MRLGAGVGVVAGVAAAGGAGVGADCASAAAKLNEIAAAATNATNATMARRNGRGQLISYSPKACSARGCLSVPVHIGKSAWQTTAMLTCQLAIRPITDIAWAFLPGKGVRHRYATLVPRFPKFAGAPPRHL